EILGIGGRGDHGADAHRRIDLAFEVEIFGDDAGVPGATGGRDHTGNEKRKDSGQDQFAPTLPAADAENAGRFFQVGGNGHGTGDHVEQDVPLRAEQQQNDRAESQTSAQANQDQQYNRKYRRGRNRSGNLRERLGDARQARIESDGNT